MTVTYSVQLEDAAGNPVSQANEPVNLYFNGNSAGATIDGGTYWTVGNPYVVDTNNQGQANVTVLVNGDRGTEYTLDASYSGQENVAAARSLRGDPGNVRD